MKKKTYQLMAFVAVMALQACSTQPKSNVDEYSQIIPFEGNVFVTQAEGDIYDAGRHTIKTFESTIENWNNPSTILSFYFKTPDTGALNLSVIAAVPEGTDKSTLTFAYNGKEQTIEVEGQQEMQYPVGTFNITEAGYVKIDIKGEATPANAQFARISKFVISGDLGASNLNCTTQETVADCYWFRRGPSVHFGYTLPEEDVEWFYNEVTVPEGKDIPNTYYMLTGFAEGYMGIQTHSDKPNNVIFSVWSPFETDNPGEIPEEQKIQTLRKGENVIARDFGGEGSGGQSFLSYAWKPGCTYKTLVHVRPTGSGQTDYTGYFCDETGKWHLVASFRRPQTDTWYKRAHSFLECFEPETSINTREVHFKNQWACTTSGEWKEVTQARFTCDNTGKIGARADMYGALEGSDFVLRNCGFFNDFTDYGTVFTRQPEGNKPSIDLKALEQL